MYDYRFEPKSMAWVEWMNVAAKHAIAAMPPSTASWFQLLTRRAMSRILTILLTNGFHVMCTGETGTGKTVAIKNHEFVNDGDRYVSIVLNFSAQTGSMPRRTSSTRNWTRSGARASLGRHLALSASSSWTTSMPAKKSTGLAPLRFSGSGWTTRAGTIGREHVHAAAGSSVHRRYGSPRAEATTQHETLQFAEFCSFLTSPYVAYSTP